VVFKKIENEYFLNNILHMFIIWSLHIQNIYGSCL